MFRNTKFEIIGLGDLKIGNEVEENGVTPEENAIKKAKEYSRLTKYITIADDTGLFLEGVEEKLQPRSYVRRINGKTLNDEEMIIYYTNLIKNHGGKVQGTWIKSIAVATDGQVFVYNYNVKKNFVEEVNSKRNKGFPLDSISITPEYNKYTVDLTPEENEDMFNFILGKLNELED
jgi:8-oxo-dGTP diphosphatase